MTTPTQPTPMEPQAAIQLLTEQVHQPAFFSKLAAHNIHPQSAEEAQALLDMGNVLWEAHCNEQEKAAQAQSSVVVKAASDLRQTLGLLSDDNHAVKQAAAAGEAQPALLEAAAIVQQLMTGGAT